MGRQPYFFAPVPYYFALDPYYWAAAPSLLSIAIHPFTFPINNHVTKYLHGEP